MKIALIQFSSKLPYPPLGILSLGSYIKKHGHKPILFDLEVHEPSFDYFEKTAQKILSCCPRVIGFSVMARSLPTVLLVAEWCKKYVPQIPIIFGGPEVSFEEIILLETFEQIDIVVRGEGEITLIELLDALENKRSFEDILGITFRDKGVVIRNPDRSFIKDLDQLPFLDFSLLPNMEKYSEAQIEGGRGCPYQCIFCSTCKMWKQKFRIKSPKRLVRELKQTYLWFKKRGVSKIRIVHDHLLLNQKWTEKFLSLIMEEGIAWSCDTRLDTLDEALVEKLKQAGCYGLALGIESGSAKIQKLINKNLNLQIFPQILTLLLKNNLPCFLSFIIGFPGEGVAELNQTLLMALKAKLYNYYSVINISFLLFNKGSELYIKRKENLFSERLHNADIPETLTGFLAEKNLIKKHPQIFPSLHHIKSNEFEPKLLEQACIIFFFLSNFFPATTLLLLKTSSLSPYQFCKRIISFLDRGKIDWWPAWELKKLFEIYPLFFKAFLGSFSRDLRELAMELFMHENLLLKISDTKKALCFYQNMSLSSCPALANGIVLMAYNYDPFAIIEILKEKQSRFSKKSSFVAYVPWKINRAVPLDQLSYNLLRFCNGENSINDIIKMLSQKNYKFKKVNPKLVIKRFMFLKEYFVVANKDENCIS